MGVTVAWLIERGVTAYWKSCLLAAFCLFAFAASLTGSDPNLNWISGPQRVVTFGLGSALAIYAVTAAELNGATFPRWSQYFGAMSYSLYVWHMPLLMLLAAAADLRFVSWIPAPLQLGLWFVIVLACAAASYEFIERPILSMGKRRARLSPASA